jgi:flagellar biosynthesis activator protein FlaF
MYRSSYAEVLEDDQIEARRIEARALDHAVGLLDRAAETTSVPSREGIEALHFTRSLWTTFMTELSSPENALPKELRANLISIGIWVLKEADAIRLGRSSNYGGIADICAIIRDGLR